VFTAKRKDIHLRSPCWNLNRIHRLESRHREFQNPPHKVKSVVRVNTHRKNSQLHHGFPLREKAREHIHPGRRDSGITDCAQARGAETLKTESQRDGIKRHKGKEIPHRNLL
jgi:hypothetical protein